MAESMSIQAILSAVDSGFSSTMKSAEQAVSGLGRMSDQTTKQNKGFMSSIKSIASGIGVYKLASVGLNAVSNSMGGAIDRFDTMNQFPKMMETMGYSAQDAQGSIDKLNKGVTGLPTALNTVVGTTQQLALMTGDLGEATDLTLALNNAFLASGSSTGDASRGLTQFSQMLSRGEVDLTSWRTLMETMPIALRQVADSFGLPEDNAYALYDALKSGDITFDEFTNRVIELSEATGGFADQAREASKGVRTSMENMGTAVIRGVEGMVSAFDDGLKSLTGKGISDWINTFSKGISKGFKSAEKGMTGFFNFIERFKPAFSEIGRVAGSAFQAVGRFFQPVGTFIKEAGASLSVFSELLTTTIGQISRGDWAGAWDSLTSNISGRFRSLSNQFTIMVGDMWTNFKGLMDRFNNFDWSVVWNGLDNFFGVIQDQILQIDFKVVGNEIGTVIREFIDANVPKLQSFVVDVLLNPNAKLNIEAGEFHAQIMALFDGFLEGLNIKVPAPINILDWSYWDAEIKEMTANYQKRLAELRSLLENVDQINVKQEVVSDIILRRGQGWEESEIQAWIDEEHGEGTYETTIELVPSLKIYDPEVSYAESIRAWADSNTEDLTIEQQVAVAIDAHIAEGGTVGELQHLIDQQFGEGTYQSTVNAEMLINVLEGAGVDQGTIQSFIDGQFGAGTYESTVNVAVNPNVSLATGHSAGASMVGGVGLSGQIESLVQSMVPKAPIAMSIPVAPQLTTGGAGASGEGGSGFDLSGITAQITSELESLKATVSATMDGINSTIMTQASTWGTSIASAMTTMVTSVTSTMTAMTLAVTLAMTAMTLAVSMAMTSLSTSVTQTMTSMAEAVAQAMTSMAEAITQAMTAMVEAVTAGMDQAVAAAEAGASSIVEAVSGLYDSMYSAGQSAGQGLTDGLNSMQGAVSAAAAALASAANVAAQAAFVINSPSKVWRGFGYSAGEGLVDGFDGSQRSVKKSATRLAVAGLPSIAPFSGRSSHVSVSGNVTNAQQNAELKAELSGIKKAIKEGQVIMLDGNTWVGATVDRIDTALGSNHSLGGRHQLS